jgi:hypothetical protein
MGSSSSAGLKMPPGISRMDSIHWPFHGVDIVYDGDWCAGPCVGGLRLLDLNLLGATKPPTSNRRVVSRFSTSSRFLKNVGPVRLAEVKSMTPRSAST